MTDTPDQGPEADCSLEVFAARMIRSGHSYDADAGIWWKADSKPGIVRELEARVQALEREVAALKGKR